MESVKEMLALWQKLTEDCKPADSIDIKVGCTTFKNCKVVGIKDFRDCEKDVK